MDVSATEEANVALSAPLEGPNKDALENVPAMLEADAMASKRKGGYG